MDDIAKIISALASLAWPILLAAFLVKLFNPIYSLIESARGRKFSIKVAGNELTMEEVSKQQLTIVSDLQNKVSELERRINAVPETVPSQSRVSEQVVKRILWVDDNPRNNSLLAAVLEERGARVDIALSTDAGVEKFKKHPYDIVLSDMGRPENDKAGIDLTKRLKNISPSTPVFIFCGSWAAKNLRTEALSAGASEITASASTLLSTLPLADEIE
jgi:CheY-like chemotaxis protein